MTAQRYIHRTTYDAEVTYSHEERRVYYYGRDGSSARGDVLDDPSDDEIERAIAEAFHDPIALHAGDHDAAGEWIDDGVRCAYCGYVCVGRPSAPSIDDDAAWAALARSHAPDCEWVLTRAHRIDERSTRS